MTSSKIQLRRFQTSDFAHLRLLESDPEIMRFTPMRVPQTPEQTEARLLNLVRREQEFGALGVWAVERNGEFVGWCMLMKMEFPNPEIGFMVVRKHWGQGIATEMVRELVSYAQEQGIQSLVAVTDVDNAASIHVLEKLGFVYETKITEQDSQGREVLLNVYNRVL